MIIKGGQVFILEDDLLPTVTITNANVIMDLPEGSNTQEMTDYMNQRCGPKSTVRNCTLRTLEEWSLEEARQNIRKSRKDVHLKAAPLGRRIMEFFGLVKA